MNLVERLVASHRAQEMLSRLDETGPGLAADHAAVGERAEVVEIQDDGEEERYVFELADGTRLTSEPVRKKTAPGLVSQHQTTHRPEPEPREDHNDDLFPDQSIDLDDEDEDPLTQLDHVEEEKSNPFEEDENPLLDLGPDELDLIEDGLQKLLDDDSVVSDPESEVRLHRLLDDFEELPDRTTVVKPRSSDEERDQRADALMEDLNSERVASFTAQVFGR